MIGDISIADNIYIICGYTDMRKSIDGLCAVIKDLLERDAENTKSLYLFCGKRSDRIKALYHEKDGFVLLISKSSGTRFENYQHDFVSAMSKAYEKYYNEAKRRNLAQTDITSKELHVICTSFWTSVYEPFTHGLSWKEIEQHCKIMCRFFNWTDTILLAER